MIEAEGMPATVLYMRSELLAQSETIVDQQFRSVLVLVERGSILILE